MRPPPLQAAEAAFQPALYADDERRFGAPRRLAARFDERRGVPLLVRDGAGRLRELLQPAGCWLSGETCFVSGTFATTANDAIGGQATGVGALISGPEGEGTTIHLLDHWRFSERTASGHRRRA